jgi:hypothetical protein
LTLVVVAVVLVLALLSVGVVSWALSSLSDCVCWSSWRHASRMLDLGLSNALEPPSWMHLRRRRRFNF